MSPYILNTAGSWDKEIHPTTPKIQNNTTQKEAEEKKGEPCTQNEFCMEVVFLVHNSKHKLTAYYKLYYRYLLHP